MRGWEPWLLTIGAVVLLAAVIWAVRARAANQGPDRGDIWWAEVPFSDGTGTKLRPCLVLLRHRRGVVVLKITSQDKSRRRDHVPIPTRSWDARATKDSYLDLGEPIMVRPAAFQRRAGACDPKILREIRTRAGLQPRELNAFAKQAS
jgi:mRNA-degrading endonuclease toxin of MazEF toxin-antitoxin module